MIIATFTNRLKTQWNKSFNVENFIGDRIEISLTNFPRQYIIILQPMLTLLIFDDISTFERNIDNSRYFFTILNGQQFHVLI